MNNLNTFINQIFTFKNNRNCVLIAIVPAFFFYIISLFGLTFLGYTLPEIIRDPAQITGASSFYGFLTIMGVWLWISSTAIAFFSLLTQLKIFSKPHLELIFLAGMLSFLLAFDDYFMIHDRYIPQNICYIAYAIFLILLLIRHYKLIIKIEGFGFILAGTFLFLSIFTDLIQDKLPMDVVHTNVIEEGFKFTGSALWLYFISRISSYRNTQ